MSSQEKYFRTIAKYKERFRKLPTMKLRQHLRDWSGILSREAAIALREILEEREQQLSEKRERIRLIRSLDELHGTCYFELLPGKYQGKCWNKNSLFITEDVFAYFEPIFERHEPSFDHYTLVEIGKDVWILIVADFNNFIQALEQAQDVQSLEGSMRFVFKQSMNRWQDDFRSNATALISVLRELSEWIEEELKKQNFISVLGI